MEKSMSEIATSLKTMPETLNTLSKDWDGGKGLKGDLNTVIKGLCTQVKIMGEQMEKLVKSIKTTQGLNSIIGEEASNAGRQNAENLDDLGQRSLMGKIAINVQDPEIKKKIGILETDDYSQFNVDLLVTEVNLHYKTSIHPYDDLQSAKRVSRSGTIILSFYDHKPGSKFFELVSAIKTKGSNAKGQNLYANFVLTHRRNALLYQIRKAHKEGKLEKYFSDYDGSLVIMKKGTTQKIRVTSQANKAKDFILKTLTLEELLHVVQ